MKLYWKYSKKTLLVSFLVSIFLPIISIFWIFFNFDLPFIHSGDKIFAWIILFCWWFFSSIFIFGWDLRDNFEK